MEKLGQAAVCVVLWCSQSRTSEWVLKEAREARRLETFLPVRIEQIELPDEFASSETIDLSGWDGSPRSDLLDRLLADIGRRVRRDPNPPFHALRDLQEQWVSHGRPSLVSFASDKANATGKFLPPTPKANLAAVAPEPSSFRPSPPPGSSTAWPRVPKLAADRVHFSLSQGTSGSLDHGDCELTVRNMSKDMLAECRVFVLSVSDGQSTYPVNEYIKKALFSLGAGLVRNVRICIRDFSDSISNPPWLLRIEGEPWPLFDELTYIVKTELRSEHKHPTIVDLELKVSSDRKKLSGRILEQKV